MADVDDPGADRSHVLWRLAVAMTTLTTVAVVLRVWSRSLLRTERRFWWDDWLAFVSWACCMCNCGFTFFGIHKGVGRHVSTIAQDKDIDEIIRGLYVSQIVFDVGITFAKASVLCLYLRILGWRQRRFKIAWSLTGALVAVYILYKLPSQIFLCLPIEKYWSPKTPGRCDNDYTNFAVLLTGLLLDVITDLMIVILPMPIISGLKLKSSRKAFLIIALFCGYMTWITSLGRMAAYLAEGNKLSSADFTWTQMQELEWSLAEICTSVFSICVPSWLYLVRRASKGGASALFHAGGLPSGHDGPQTMSTVYNRASSAWRAATMRTFRPRLQSEQIPSETSPRARQQSTPGNTEVPSANHDINIRTDMSVEFEERRDFKGGGGGASEVMPDACLSTSVNQK